MKLVKWLWKLWFPTRQEVRLSRRGRRAMRWGIRYEHARNRLASCAIIGMVMAYTRYRY